MGDILRSIREELVERNPLVDELAVVDSRSTDRTCEIASSEGAKIIFDDEVLPSFEPKAHGKGEALWKSVFALKGDIICWIDSDIRNFHPRFVYGLCGPLIMSTNIGFVKGFYRRPLFEGGVLKNTGGGRVTELVARPMINLFYPELSCLIQPLSGEYAGRREILENVPFFTGYGVEIGLVLDIYRKFGLEKFAQVDLDSREHFNQPVEALGRMSFEIYLVMLKRLKEDGKLDLKVQPGKVYNRVVKRKEGFSVESFKFEVFERPPAREVPGYLEGRKQFEGEKGKDSSA